MEVLLAHIRPYARSTSILKFLKYVVPVTVLSDELDILFMALHSVKFREMKGVPLPQAVNEPPYLLVKLIKGTYRLDDELIRFTQGLLTFSRVRDSREACMSLEGSLPVISLRTVSRCSLR